MADIRSSGRRIVGRDRPPPREYGIHLSDQFLQEEVMNNKWFKQELRKIIREELEKILKK